jgi:hypothetical protein
VNLSTTLRRAAVPLKRAQAAWQFDRGIPAPPATYAKRHHLLKLLTEGGHHTVIETGTYLGETTAFLSAHAARVISIEIEPRLHALAVERFRDQPHVEIMLGDALEVVPGLVGGLDEPCLLWLDGHASGGITGTGALQEPAEQILHRIGAQQPPRGMTIVVDDLRMFGSDPGVPTLEALVDSARETFPQARLNVELDALIIRDER